MKMKKISFIMAVSFLMVVTLFSCSKTSDGTKVSGSQVLTVTTGTGESIIRIGLDYDPNTLSPFSSMNGGIIATRRTIYEFLIDRDTFGGEMRGTLMSNWKQVDDITYDVTIYDYIYDTAGNHVTASDVKFSYDTSKTLGNMPKLNIINNIEIIDGYTARFVFKNPLTLGDLEGIWSECPVVSEASYKASPDSMARTPIGTTAYKVTEYTTGSKITLRKADEYWQTDTSKMPKAAFSNVDAIEFHIIREAAQMAIALETGAIDITNGIRNKQQIARFNQGGELATNYNAFQYKDNLIYVTAMNCERGKPFYNNTALRQAVTYAIDSQGIVDGVYGGNAIALKSIGYDKYAGFNPAWNNEEYYEYNPAKAKSLMAQAGYPNGGLTLTVLCSNIEDTVNTATIIQAYLAEIGIDLKINSYENAMFQNLKTDSSAYDLLMTTYASTDYLANVWKLAFYAPNYNGHTETFVVDDKLQELLAKCIAPATHTQENMDILHHYLKDTMYVYGLVATSGFVLSNKKVTDVMLDMRNCIIPGACTYNF
jgi:ABC-type transport system substrate-binding protein